MFVYLRSMSNTNTIQQHSTESTLSKYQNSSKKKSLFSPNTLNFPLIARDIGYTMQNRKKKKKKSRSLWKNKKKFYKNFIPWRPFSKLAYIKLNVDCFERFVRRLACIYPTGMEEKSGERVRGKIGTRTVRLQWIA